MYEDLTKFAEVKKFMEEQLEDYNMEPGIIPMGLVLFRDAIEHGMEQYQLCTHPILQAPLFNLLGMIGSPYCGGALRGHFGAYLNWTF